MAVAHDERGAARARAVVSALARGAGTEVAVALHALFVTSGDVAAAAAYLADPARERARTWSPAEDAALMGTDADAIRAVARRRGRANALGRCAFLSPDAAERS